MGFEAHGGIEPARKSIFWSQLKECDKQGNAHVINTEYLVDLRIAQPDLANGTRFQVLMKGRSMLFHLHLE
jgi:hypothetical protein